MQNSAGPTTDEIGIYLASRPLFPFERTALHTTREAEASLIAELRRRDATAFGLVYLGHDTNVTRRENEAIVGTLAHIEASSPFTRGRWTILIDGQRRFRVLSWKAMDPFPVARVEYLEDDDSDDAGPHLSKAAASVQQVRGLFERLGDREIRQFDELGEVSSTSDWYWRLATAAPLTPDDRQQILEADGPIRRAQLLTTLMKALYQDFIPLGRYLR